MSISDWSTDVCSSDLKSTLINDTLYTLAANELNGASRPVAPCKSVEHMDLFDKVVDIDQSPIGRTPRSNPATYTGLFTPLRELFAQVPEARARGYAARLEEHTSELQSLMRTSYAVFCLTHKISYHPRSVLICLSLHYNHTCTSRMQS